MSYKHYSKDFKASIIEEIKKGVKTQLQISEETGIPQATLSRWANNVKIKQQKKFKKTLFAPKKKDYFEMNFEELLEALPSDYHKNYAMRLHQQYKDKGIALRYCYISLNLKIKQPTSEKQKEEN